MEQAPRLEGKAPLTSGKGGAPKSGCSSYTYFCDELLQTSFQIIE